MKFEVSHCWLLPSTSTHQAFAIRTYGHVHTTVGLCILHIVIYSLQCVLATHIVYMFSDACTDHLVMLWHTDACTDHLVMLWHTGACFRFGNKSD